MSKKIVRCVKSQVGKPYVYGAAGPNSFDCSGLDYYCHGKSIGLLMIKHGGKIC